MWSLLLIICEVVLVILYGKRVFCIYIYGENWLYDLYKKMRYYEFKFREFKLNFIILIIDMLWLYIC